MLKIRRYNTTDATFDASLHQLLAFEGAQDDKVDAVVADILNDVKRRGDAAVLEYTQRFDRVSAESMDDLELPQARLTEALGSLPAEQRDALKAAAERVRVYHEKQLMTSWSYTEADGTMLGQQVTALDCMGFFPQIYLGCHSCQGGGREGIDHGGAYAGWRKKSAGVGRCRSVRCRSRVLHRWRTSSRRVGLWHADRAAGRQDRRPR